MASITNVLGCSNTTWLQELPPDQKLEQDDQDHKSS